MNEIYWITRFDSINTAILPFLIIGTILSVVVTVGYYVTNGQYIHDKSKGCISNAEEDLGYRNTFRDILKYSIPITTISFLLTIFIPSTKEALLIYGIGGTVDYIKSNPTARQLPDKCIIALDKWVDSIGIKEKSDSTKNGKN